MQPQHQCEIHWEPEHPGEIDTESFSQGDQQATKSRMTRYLNHLSHTGKHPCLRACRSSINKVCGRAMFFMSKYVKVLDVCFTSTVCFFVLNYCLVMLDTSEKSHDAIPTSTKRVRKLSLLVAQSEKKIAIFETKLGRLVPHT